MSEEYTRKPRGLPMDIYRDPETFEIIAVPHRCDGVNCRYAVLGRRPCDDNPAPRFRDDDK